MRLNKLLSTSVLSFSVLLGASSLMYAQEQRDEAKPQEEARPEAAKPQDEMKPRQEEAKPQKQEEEKDKARNQNEEKAAKQNDAKNAKEAQQADKANHAQRADQRGGRIPDDKFRAHFGRQHTFVVNHPTIVGGQPRFQYGGYSFTIVDVWPAGWAYTDQCYIDYIDGEYFLFDLAHPGVQVALVVVL
jgi:hypothetical protein